jgi:thiamine biosynthesis lipoprotein
VQVAAGIRLDAGGIGKGLAADLVAADTMADGAAAVAVMIGGDGRVRSADPGRPWAIEIAAPSGVGSVDRIATSDAAIATSGFHRAHLVDPTTGALCRPGDIVQASVLAGTGVSAEALTKAVLVGGDEDIPDQLDRYGVGVLAVHADGGLSANTTWRSHRTRSGATAA